MWTTVPPAKSIASIPLAWFHALRNPPLPHTMCAIGQYTPSSHSTENTTIDENFIRSAYAPQMSPSPGPVILSPSAALVSIHALSPLLTSFLSLICTSSELATGGPTGAACAAAPAGATAAASAGAVVACPRATEAVSTHANER